MLKDYEKVLKYIVDGVNNGKCPTFIDICNDLDFQVQDLQVIIEYLIKNDYYIIFNETNTKVDWNRYNGIPSVKGRMYFKTKRENTVINFFKYAFFNIFVPILVAGTTSIIIEILTKSK